MNSDQFSYTPSRGEFTYNGILYNAYTTVDIIKKVENFDFFPTDIVVNTFPRSGTTLTQEIVWHIKNKNVICKGKKYGDIDQRFPFLEYNSKFDNPDASFSVDVLPNKTDALYRLIKTHCPFNFIGSNLCAARPKCIVVFRNPRDVCVSLYHFYKGMQLFGPWQGTWEEFLEMFMRGFTKCGSWNEWHKDWWEEIAVSSMGSNPFAVRSKNDLPVLFYSFEMLIRSPEIVIKAIANFLDESLTEEQMDIILYNTNFKQMSNDQDLNFKDHLTGFRFIRKGQIGNWKKYFNEKQLMIFQSKVEKEMNKKGINFEYE